MKFQLMRNKNVTLSYNATSLNCWIFAPKNFGLVASDIFSDGLLRAPIARVMNPVLHTGPSSHRPVNRRENH